MGRPKKKKNPTTIRKKKAGRPRKSGPTVKKNPVRRKKQAAAGRGKTGSGPGKTLELLHPDGQPDWHNIEQQALIWFKDLLRIDTTNPPGNEKVAIDYLGKILKAEGIPFRKIDTDQDRACLIGWYSGPADHTPAQRPLILTSHVDVVPHDPEKWDFPAFAAEEHNGYIYGRGTVDMKNMTILSLMTIVLAKRMKWRPHRELIFSAVADEEAGSRYGMEYLVNFHPEVFHEAEFALNEVGGYTLHMNGNRLYPIQTAEKGFLWARLSLEGKPGHGSLPHGENALVHLSRVVDRMYHRTRPVHVDDSARQFIDALAGLLPIPRRQVLKLVKSRVFGNTIIRRVVPAGEQRTFLNAITHDTISPTIMKAGSKENVIPGRASLTLDCRLLPGTTPENYLAALKKEVSAITNLPVKIEIINSAEAATWSYDTDLFRHLKQSLEEADPGALAVPYLVSGFTDSKFLARLGVTCYGFTPVKIPEGLKFSELFHGHNERIPVDGFLWGLETFYHTVKSFVTKPYFADKPASPPEPA